jgi:glutathionylspermidine synthase
MHSALMKIAADSLRDGEAQRSRLDIPSGLWAEAQASLERGERPILGRFDFALEASDTPGIFTPRLLEFNADNPGCIPESIFAQQAFEESWLRELGVAGRTTGSELHKAVTEALDRMFHTCNTVSVLHHPGDEYIARVAKCLEDMCRKSIEGEVQRYEYPKVPPIDDATHMGVIKLFRWSPLFAVSDDNTVYSKFPEVSTFLQAHSAARKAAHVGMSIMEPPISSLLNHKGLFVRLAEMYPHHANVLKTIFTHPETLPGAATKGTVFKPFTGLAGNGVELIEPSAYTTTPPMPKGAVEAERIGVHQERVPAVNFSRIPSKPMFAILCTWMVNGKCAGMIVRECDSPVTNMVDGSVPVVVTDV